MLAGAGSPSLAMHPLLADFACTPQGGEAALCSQEVLGVNHGSWERHAGMQPLPRRRREKSPTGDTPLRKEMFEEEQ